MNIYSQERPWDKRALYRLQHCKLTKLKLLQAETSYGGSYKASPRIVALQPSGVGKQETGKIMETVSC